MSIEKEIARYICFYMTEMWKNDGVFDGADILLNALVQAPEEWEWAFENNYISQEAYNAILDGEVDAFEVGDLIAKHLDKF